MQGFGGFDQASSSGFGQGQGLKRPAASLGDFANDYGMGFGSGGQGFYSQPKRGYFGHGGGY